MNFAVYPAGSRAVHLSWNPPLPENHNGILRHYVVTVTSEKTTESITTSSEATSIRVTGLRPFTTYLCTVAAVTVAAGPATDAMQVQTEEDGRCFYAEVHVPTETL